MDYRRRSKRIGPALTTLFTGGQTLDLVALSDLKLELNLSETSDDAYLAKLITRASSAAARFCNRTFVPALWLDHIVPASDAYPWQTPPVLTKLQVAQWPLTATPSPAMTAPPLAPSLSSVAGGALAAASYYARVTYVSPLGETAASLETFLPIAANQLLQIAAPTTDPYALATGWNVYLSTSSYTETLQNTTPIALGTSWTLPTSGLVTGAAAPSYVTIVEERLPAPTPLAEGVDFVVDAERGQIDRLNSLTSRTREWRLPATVIYPAGYAAIPDDLQEAVILLAKLRWFARGRDAALKSETIPGVYSASYLAGGAAGVQGDMPAEVAEKLDRYRTTVVA